MSGLPFVGAHLIGWLVVGMPPRWQDSSTLLSEWMVVIGGLRPPGEADR